MQQITYKNTTLTLSQKFFIEKSLELVYSHSIDSYRVRVRNPRSILKEIVTCIDNFNKGQIKHFETISGKSSSTPSLLTEAKNLIADSNSCLEFKTYDREFIIKLLNNLSKDNYKHCRKALEAIINDNDTYLNKVLSAIKDAIDFAPSNDSEQINSLKKIDSLTNFLMSDLIDRGFSKGFLYKKLRVIFINTLNDETNFDTKFNEFLDRIFRQTNQYAIVFKLNCSTKTKEALESVEQSRMTVSDKISEDLILQDNPSATFIYKRNFAEYQKFASGGSRTKYLKVIIDDAPDNISALKKAKIVLAENLDIINLGFSEDQMHLHSRAYIVDLSKTASGNFKHLKEPLDGKYTETQQQYENFITKINSILNNNRISHETKEKIKSAIRYLRLGNESIEVEHKFINYWIGLEYLFSNYESQSTINRLKDHFVNAHLLIYLKRNTHTFFKYFNTLPVTIKNSISNYIRDNDNCLLDEQFYYQCYNALKDTNILLAYRSVRLREWFFTSGNIKKYLNNHKENLLIHLTRVYRIRNEIVHDAITNTNYEHIAANLKYYLTFILNSLMEYLCNCMDEEISIENYFTLNELRYSNLEHKSYPLSDLMKIDDSIDFIG